MKNIILLGLMAFAPAPSEGKPILASWYQSGAITASGEKFSPKKLTAAHRFLPFGTMVKVRYKKLYVWVKINDRGPFKRGRGLDLSKGAARKIGMEGVQIVELLKIKKPKVRG